jgi:diguanylate cyclase (GGDEF)-like protein
MRLPRLTRGWLIFGVAVIAVLAWLPIIGLRQYVNDRQKVLESFNTIVQQAHHQNALEWQSIAEQQVSDEIRQDVLESRALMKRLTQELLQSPVTWQELENPFQVLQSYQNAVDHEFVLLEAGQLEAAKEWDEAQVDPDFEKLITLFKAYAKVLKQAVQQAGLLADFGSFFTLLFAIMFVAMIMWRFKQVEQTIQVLEAKKTILEVESERDTLTGLLNRRGFSRQQLMTDQVYALAMVDVNELKFINDHSGHGAGDVYLQGIATTLTELTPSGTIIGRWGGDEFVLLVPDSLANTQELLSRVARSIQGANPQRAAFSFGLAQIKSGESLERAVAIADAQMYDHKSEGRINDKGEWSLTTPEDFSAQLERFHRPEEVIEIGISMLRSLLGFDASYYLECQNLGVIPSNSEDETFAVRHIDGNLPAPIRLILEQSRYKTGVGIAGRAIQLNSSTWTNDYANDPDALQAWVEFGVKSTIVEPVFLGGQLQGLVGLFNFNSWKPITPQVRALTAAVALRLGHALERVSALQDVQRSLEGGFFALGVALEARDFETKGHTERVVKLAEAIGQKFGLDRSAFEALKHGAFLHDIGKLSVPDSILLKPGKLDANEWAIMKTHAEKGFEIASRIPTLNRGALEVVRSHHERWDGTGYPDNLVGTRIPLLARIFAICDVYDALISERAYKRAWTKEQALSEIDFQSGKHFDPAVVQVFFEVISNEVENVTGTPLSWSSTALKASA